MYTVIEALTKIDSTLPPECHSDNLVEAWQTLKPWVLAQQTNNSAMDAIVLIKEVAERMDKSTEDGCIITLCPCHGLGARIIELAQQHQ